MTPTSYLELIAAFRLLLTQKREAVMKAKQRYTNGLDQLAFAGSQVHAALFTPEIPNLQYFSHFNSFLAGQ